MSICDYCQNKIGKGVIICPEFLGSKCYNCMQIEIIRLEDQIRICERKINNLKSYIED